MTNSDVEDGLARFERWLVYWFARPVGKLALTVLLWLFLAGCVQWDEHVRATGRKSLPMAPTRADFLFSLQLGAAIGLLAFLCDFLHSLCRAGARLFRASHERERPRPERSRVSAGAVWDMTGGLLCFVLFVALSVWCAVQQVFPPPAWIAALAILVPGMLLLELIFGAERRDEAPQEVPAEN
jgi:hypothetical protein